MSTADDRETSELARARAELAAARAELAEARTELDTLRDREAGYRSVIAAMSEGVVVQTETAAIIACNPAAERILGLTAAQLDGRTSLDPRWRAIHEDGSPFPGERHPAIVTLRTGAPCRDVVMGVHKPDGSLGWILINTEPVSGGVGPDAPRVVCTFTDITAYRQALDDLRRTEERLVFALRAARMGAWTWEIERGQLIWSDTVEEVFGVPRGTFDGTFDTYLGLLHPEDRARVAETIAAAADDPAQDGLYVRHRILVDGRERWIDGHGRVFRDATGRAVRMAGVAVDVTEMRRLEQEARQAQRLDAVGRLAGGVAHDFNNVLTVIGSAAALAARPGRDPRPDLAVIADATERAARLTRQLLAFARRQTIGVVDVDLAAMLTELRPLLGHLLGERIALAVDVEAGAWKVRADQSQLEQVLVNLVANARDAIPDAGHVRIALEDDGDHVAILVEDDGAGMTAEVLEHVFEPFFTTKATGTGLGLATCYGIVEQHGGHIEVRSRPGAGTRVIVRLPRQRGGRAPRRTTAPPPAGGTETVLLVEDDPAIRGLVERLLADQGYRVLVAGDGVEALEVAAPHLPDLSAVVSDVVMPRLGGVALVERLRALRPDVAVLLMTGYAAAQPVPADLPLLDKPFTPDQLTRRLRALLDARATRAGGPERVSG